MSIKVQTPDGGIAEFPDGTPTAAIESALRQKFGGPDTAAAAQPRKSTAPAPQPQTVAGAQMQGLGNMMFGLNIPLEAAGEYTRGNLMGLGTTWHDAYKSAQQIDQQAVEQYPWNYRAGEAVGLVGGGGLVKGAVSAIARLAPRAAQAVGSILALQKGQRAANVARVAATGATAGGVTALNESGDVGEVPAGAAGGAVLGPLAAGAGNAVGRAMTLAAAKVPPYAKLLAKRLSVSPDVVAQNFSDLSAATGHPPTAAALIDSVQHERLASIWQARPDAAMALREGISASAVARQEHMRSAIEAGTPTPASEDISRAANDQLSKVLQTRPANGAPPVEQQRVKLTQDEVDSLVGDEADQFRALPRTLRKRVITDLTAAGDNTLSVRSLEDLRLNAAQRANGVGEGPANWREYRDMARELAARNREYASAMDAYAGQMRRAGAVADEGASAVSASTNPIEYAGAVRTMYKNAPTPALQQGTRQGLGEGVRSALVADTGSPGGAVRTAKRLDRDMALQKNIATAAGPNEAARLRGIGRGETAAAENEMSAVRATGSLNGDQKETTQVIQGIAAGLSPSLSVPYKVFWAAKLAKLGVRASTAKDLANAIADPKQTAAVLRYLRRIGVAHQQVLAWTHEFAAMGGATGATTTQAFQPALTTDEGQ